MHFERPEIIRPPSEWKSYFLPLTAGCSNNTCGFCNYYGSKLRLRSEEEVKEEIDALARYLDSGIQLPAMHYLVYAIARSWDQKKVFLQDGDALVYPFPKLAAVLAYLTEKIPAVERVGTYATARDILRKSPEELKILQGLKLGIIYMGLESGDEDVLREINKGVDSREMIEAAKKVKEAGIILSVTVILGLGGVEGSEKHALETARVLSEIDPDYAGALTLTLVPGTPLYERAKEGSFRPVTPLRSLEELKIIIENSSFSNCFFSSMHASNYFSVRGRLPDDREKMLGELGYILARKDPSLLRPDFLRGL
jgi:radical SAM superfamily enzyme YgiQ (UPF0313 family)